VIRTVAREAGLKPTLVPLPFAAWHALAWIAEVLPSPPVTWNQVELMQVDTISSPQSPGFGELWNFAALARGGTPANVSEALIKELLLGYDAPSR
jgi:hypothetical protein